MRRFCVGGVVPAAATAVGVRVPALRLCSPSSRAEGRGRRCREARASRGLEARTLPQREDYKNADVARCLLAMVIGCRCSQPVWRHANLGQATRDILASKILAISRLQLPFRTYPQRQGTWSRQHGAWQGRAAAAAHDATAPQWRPPPTKQRPTARFSTPTTPSTRPRTGKYLGDTMGNGRGAYFRSSRPPPGPGSACPRPAAAAPRRP